MGQLVQADGDARARHPSSPHHPPSAAKAAAQAWILLPEGKHVHGFLQIFPWGKHPLYKQVTPVHPQRALFQQGGYQRARL